MEAEGFLLHFGEQSFHLGALLNDFIYMKITLKLP